MSRTSRGQMDESFAANFTIAILDQIAPGEIVPRPRPRHSLTAAEETKGEMSDVGGELRVSRDIFVKATMMTTTAARVPRRATHFAERQRINLRRKPSVAVCDRVRARARETRTRVCIGAMRESRGHDTHTTRTRESALCGTRMQLVWVITVSCSSPRRRPPPRRAYIHIGSLFGPTM